jgi:hypothetical protein
MFGDMLKSTVHYQLADNSLIHQSQIGDRFQTIQDANNKVP